jgi:hypothetical protein
MDLPTILITQAEFDALPKSDSTAYDQPRCRAQSETGQWLLIDRDDEIKAAVIEISFNKGTIHDTKIKKVLARGRHRAIIKDVAGRRMLIGFEPSNPNSRKRHVKLMTSLIDLDQLGKDTKAAVEASAADAPKPTATNPIEDLAKQVADKLPPPPKKEPPAPPEKTPADLQAIEAAQAKRDRKAKRRES